jgi:hypothetical protein
MITHKSIGYSGRLGNQMFQYAALKSIALLMNQNIVLPNNISIKEDGAYDFTNNKWIPYKLDLLDCFDLNCSFQNIPDDNGIIEIDGYFQSYKHFIGNEQYILDEFKFKAHILNKCTDIIGKYNNPVYLYNREAPISAYKLSADGTEALLLTQHGCNIGYTKTDFSLRLPTKANKEILVSTWGNYTSVIRIKDL